MPRFLSPVDAVFMTVEKAANPMHIAGLQLFTPPAGADATDVGKMFTAAEDGVAADFFRQRAVRSWSTAGQWAWEEVDVELDHHVQTHVLDEPGRIRDLLALCSELHGQRLDRHRPPWQAHLITGLTDGRFALYFKIHHALGDGVRAQRLLSSVLSPDAEHRSANPPWVGESHSAAPAPAAPAAGSEWAEIARSLLGEVPALASVLGQTLLRGLRHETAPLSFDAPRSILNPASISGSRRFAAQSWPMARIRAVGKAAGATVNDVVLAMCAGALRAYLTDLNALPDASLVAMVPVALRDAGTLGPSANAVGAVMCALGTQLDDPADRLAAIHASMAEGKAVLRSMTPTQILAMTAVGMGPLLLEPVLGRVAGTRPPFNLIISNVPGARVPLHFNGARLDGMYPLSIPLDGQALNITCTTYCGDVSFGLTGCARTVPHLQRLLGHLDQGLLDLEGAIGVG